MITKTNFNNQLKNIIGAPPDSFLVLEMSYKDMVRKHVIFTGMIISESDFKKYKLWDQSLSDDELIPIVEQITS